MNKIEYPASITKVMTGLLALENSNLDDIITKLNNFVKDNIQILSNGIVTILKIFIGFILGFVFNNYCENKY